MIEVTFGIYGRKDLQVEGWCVKDVYHLLDDVQRNLGGGVERKLFIHSFINDVETGEDANTDMTIVKNGDWVDFRRVLPDGYVRPAPSQFEIKWRYSIQRLRHYLNG